MEDTIIIAGHAGTDAALVPTKSGTPFASFRLASSHRRRSAGGETREETSWYRVVAFHELAEHMAQSIRRGEAVLVTGRIRIAEWEHEGQRRSSVEVVAEAIGHNLRWGTSRFERAIRSAHAAEQAAASDGEAVEGAMVDWAATPESDDVPVPF